MCSNRRSQRSNGNYRPDTSVESSGEFDDERQIFVLLISSIYLSGANLPDPLSTRLFPARCCGLHKDGLFKPGDGVRAESAPMHVERSKSNSGKYSQGDEFYSSTHHQHGHVRGHVHNLSMDLAPGEGVRQ